MYFTKYREHTTVFTEFIRSIKAKNKLTLIFFEKGAFSSTAHIPINVKIFLFNSSGLIAFVLLLFLSLTRKELAQNWPSPTKHPLLFRRRVSLFVTAVEISLKIHERV